VAGVGEVYKTGGVLQVPMMHDDSPLLRDLLIFRDFDIAAAAAMHRLFKFFVKK
jgi:hypothetical protein